MVRWWDEWPGGEAGAVVECCCWWGPGPEVCPFPVHLRLTVELALVGGHVQRGVSVLDPLVRNAVPAAQFSEHARDRDVALLASNVKRSGPIVLRRVHGGTAPCEVPSLSA